MGISVSISTIPSIQNRSEATPELWNQRFSIIEENFNNIRTGFSAAIALAYPSSDKTISNINYYSSIVIKSIDSTMYTFKTDGRVLANNFEVNEIRADYKDHDLVPLKYIRDNFSGGGGGGGGGAAGSSDFLSANSSTNGVGSGGTAYWTVNQPSGKQGPVMFSGGLYAVQSNLGMRSEHSIINRKYLSQLIYRDQNNNTPWQTTGMVKFGGPLEIPEDSRATGLKSDKFKATSYASSDEDTVVSHDEVPTFKHLNMAFGLTDNSTDWSRIYNGNQDTFFTINRHVVFRKQVEPNTSRDLLSVGNLKSDPGKFGVEFNNPPMVIYGHNTFTFPNGAASSNLVNSEGVDAGKYVVTVGNMQRFVEWTFNAFGFRILDKSALSPSETAYGRVFGDEGNAPPTGKMLGFKLPSWLGGYGVCVIRVENCPFGKLADIEIPQGFTNFYWSATAHSSEIVAAGVDTVSNALRFRLAKLFGNKTGTVACTFIGLGK